MSKLAFGPVPCRLIDEVIERTQTEMPDCYMRSAEGVAIAGQEMLRAAGHRPGAVDPIGWTHAASGFRKTGRDGKTILWVQRCGRFWIVERSLRLHSGYMHDEALSLASIPLPIWTRTRQEAMRLAEYCDQTPPALAGVKWVDVGDVPVIGDTTKRGVKRFNVLRLVQ